MIITQNGPQSIGQIQIHFRSGNIFLSPIEYQRENAWDLPQKKLLIDTIFRKMDIPKFYLWKIDERSLKSYPEGKVRDYYKKLLADKREKNDDLDPYIYEVVDGQQRLRTILEYMDCKPTIELVYRGTWYPPYAASDDTPIAKGRLYSDLNAEQKIQFDQVNLSIMILENATIDEIRDMFLRLQNGTPLNAQQKRNATGSTIVATTAELAKTPFFKTSVNFDNHMGDHDRVIAQMLMLEYYGRIVSCTSQKLDKFYAAHKTTKISNDVIARCKSVLKIIGKIFPKRNPALNRSYAVGLYWSFSKILHIYDIPESEYCNLARNFE